MRILVTFILLFSGLANAQLNFVNRADELNLDVHTGNSQFGNGVSVHDFNGDGLDDISMATSQALPIFVYKNTGSTFELQDLNLPQNISQIKQINWVDIDNDGDKDLFLTSNESGNRLYENDGTLNFTDITASSGMPQGNLYTAGASWGDYNNDGFLDLFLSNKDDNLVRGNLLFKNQGNSTFIDVTVNSGINPDAMLSFCAAFFDFNNDGYQDIYIANDRTNFTNVLYKNNGDGTFLDLSADSNTNIAIDAMSVTIGDYNNDGFFDIYVTNTPSGNVFLKNNGDESFTDVTSVTDTSFGSVAWGAVFLDAENDMDLDLYVSGSFTGSDPALLSSAFYRNNNDDTFALSDDCGFVGDNSRSFANAIGDFNNDGLPDIVVNNSVNNTMFLWENQSVTTNNYLKVKLQGTQSNSDGIGSVIEISIGGEKQFRYTLNGEGYLGQNSAYKIFGLGNASKVDYIKVKWLSGVVDVFNNVSANQNITIVEDSNTLSINSFVSKTPSIFPNPAKDYIVFNHIKTDMFVTVYNILGQKMAEIEATSLINNRLDISKYSKGVYLVKLGDEVTLKFIKD